MNREYFKAVVFFCSLWKSCIYCYCDESHDFLCLASHCTIPVCGGFRYSRLASHCTIPVCLLFCFRYSRLASRCTIPVCCGFRYSRLASHCTIPVCLLFCFRYSLNSTVWCCAWNTHDTNVFYAGMERGVVREFDIRRTNTHVRDVLDSGGSPISNIQFWRGSDAQGK